jgi:hypothetical protein
VNFKPPGAKRPTYAAQLTAKAQSILSQTQPDAALYKGHKGNLRFVTQSKSFAFFAALRALKTRHLVVCKRNLHLWGLCG